MIVVLTDWQSIRAALGLAARPSADSTAQRTEEPELWTPAFLARLFAVMREGGTLATYSAKGSVRRSLDAVGFRVGKRSGPPGKREMLVAVR
jgi:tRNA U34 5-methylaminomethyl-2-thiouridine-forming methyltransferase MnmC